MGVKFKNNKRSRGTRNRNFFQRVFLNQIFLFFLGLAIVIAIASPLTRNIKKQYSTNKEIKALKQEISGQKNKNLSLSELIAYIKSDEFVEEQARLDLNYKKRGEDVLVIKEKSEEPGIKSGKNESFGKQTDSNNNLKISNQLKWLLYFLK